MGANLELWVSFIFSLVWGLTLLLFLIGKVISEGSDSFFQHYTNWNWSISTAYFLADIIAFFDPTGNLLFVLIIGGFWFVHGSAWLVFWLVFIMFADNAKVITDLSTEGGGSFDMGFLLDMNTVFHTLPAVMTLIYIFLRRRELSKGMRVVEVNLLPGFRIAYIIISLAMPLLFLGVYCAFMNLREVYGITTNIVIIMLVCLGVIGVFSGIPMMLLRRRGNRHSFKRLKKREYRQDMEATNDFTKWHFDITSNK